MPQSLRVLVFNADEPFAPELRRVLLRVSGLKIVAEIDEASLLPQAITRFPADLIFVNLDPDIGVVLEVMRQILETHTRLPVFALSASTEGDVVLRAMRAGFREFLVKPLAQEELGRALAKLEIDPTDAKDPGKLIAVMGCSGGVGVSVVATNLAVELANLVGEPRRVALVDLDFRFGHIATLLDLHPQFTVAELCESPEHVDRTMIDKATVDHESGVRVLARPNDFAQAEMVTAAHCITILSALADVCDYVVVDGPTRYDPAGQSVIDAADYNLLVMQLLVTSVRNADRIFRELGQQGFNLDRIQLICNRLNNDPGYLDLDQVQKTLGRPIFATIPDEWKVVSNAINMGQPLCAEWSKSKVRQAIAGLALKIHDPQRAAESERGGRSSLLSKLWRSGKKETAPDEAAPAPGTGSSSPLAPAQA